MTAIQADISGKWRDRTNQEHKTIKSKMKQVTEEASYLKTVRELSSSPNDPESQETYVSETVTSPLLPNKKQSKTGILVNGTEYKTPETRVRRIQPNFGVSDVVKKDVGNLKMRGTKSLSADRLSTCLCGCCWCVLCVNS